MNEVQVRTERMRRAFDLARIRASYVGKGLLDEAEFNAIFRDVGRIRTAGIGGLDWVLLDHVLSVCRGIPLDDHIEALSAGLGRSFDGVGKFFETLVEMGLESPTVLNRTTFYRVPKGSAFLGQLLVELGALDMQQMQRGLGIKSQILQLVGVDAAVGQIFRSLTNLSIIDLFQALAIQVGLPFIDLDQSASAIFTAVANRPEEAMPHHTAPPR